MGIRSAVASAVIKWAASIMDAHRSAMPTFSGSLMAGQPVPTEWSTEKAVKEGYKASYIYYSASSDLADCIRSVPWVLKRRGTDSSKVVDKHPLSKMLRYPNADKTWGALCEEWDLYKSLSGNAYATFAVIGDTVKVWNLRPDRVTIVPDAKGQIAAFRYSQGMGKHTDYKPEEVLHFMFFDPSSDYYGMSPLQAASRIVDTSNAAVDWNRGSMGHRARPDGMFAPKTPLSPMQYTTWRDQIKKQLSGPSNAHKILLNPFDAEFTSFELTPIEMDFIKSFETYEDAVCKPLHLHPEALGKSGATFENKKWALRAKWEGPVTSRLREMRAVINHKFGPLYGTSYPAAEGDLYVDYDLSDTPAVIEARKEASEEATKYFKMGVPFNDISEKLDLPFDPIPGGDVGYLPVNVLPAGTPAGARSTRAVDDHRQLWRAIDQRKQGWERGVDVKVSALFSAESRMVVKAVEGGNTNTDKIINSHRSEWDKLIKAVMRAVIEDFGEQTADTLSESVPEIGRGALKPVATLSGDRAGDESYFDPWTPAIQDWVSTNTAEHVKSIVTTTKVAIQGVVQAGIDDGLSMVKIARQVREKFNGWEGGTDVYRSLMIARTEVHTASSYAMHESARQSGVAQEKSWLTAGDDRVRDSHIENEAAGWIPFDDVYPNGAAHPGDGPDSIQCRCVELFRSSK